MAFLDIFKRKKAKNNVEKCVNIALHNENSGLSEVSAQKATPIKESKERSYMGEVSKPNTITDLIMNYKWGNNSNLNSTREINEFLFLRDFAKHCGVVAYCIQYIQNQITSLDYQVVYREKGKQKDEKCAEVEALLRRPNRRQRNLRSLLNAMIKDFLVVDAMAIKPLYASNKKDVIAIELLDPAYISLKIDERGQVPAFPQTAYQFNVPEKNVILNYNIKDILYSVYDSSSYDMYGESAMEKCLNAVRSLIRRRGYIDAYFTNGNLPDNMISVGEEMTPEEMFEWQFALQNFLGEGMGLDERKWQTRLLPKDWKLIQAKSPELQQDIDEVFIKEICGIFGVPPSALIGTQNKASSESIRRITDSSELSAKIKYIEETLTTFINEYIGYDDLVFVFKEPTASDRLQQAQISNLFSSAGILTTNEIREMLGYGPLSDEELARMGNNKTSNTEDSQPKGENRPIGQKDTDIDDKEVESRIPNQNEDR